VKLLDVELVEVISLVVVKDSASFVMLFKVVRRVVLLVLVVTTSFVVVKDICPVAGVCHIININMVLPQNINTYKHIITYIPVVDLLVPRNAVVFISVLSVVDVVVSVETNI